MFKRFALAATAVIFSASAAPAVTVLNGSFEAPDYSTGSGTYVYNPTGGDWTFSGGSGVTALPSAWGFSTPPAGDQAAFLQNISSISQTITGLTIGQSYSIDFSLSNRPGYDLNAVFVSFGGVDLVNYTPTTSWSNYSTLFTATATSGVLSFSTNALTGDHDAGLDAVSISAVGAVPEIATWGMMLVGFGAMGGAMRRRRTQFVFG